MSDISLDSIKSIVTTALDQFQEAVFLLKAVHDGTSSQQEIAGFLNRIGIATSDEPVSVRENEDAMLVAQALVFLNADAPPSGIMERDWSSPAREHLSIVLGNTPLEYFRTIVEDRVNEMWLVGQTLKQWAAWASGGYGKRPGPNHKDRIAVIAIVEALLKELRK